MRTASIACWTASALAAFALRYEAQAAESQAGAAPATAAAPAVEARGQTILEQVLEANRYWLLGPPAAVTNFGYSFHLQDNQPEAVTAVSPKSVSHAKRWGVTYFSLLHALAMKTSQATVRELAEADGLITLSLAFTPPVKGHCGNGLEGRWRGYFNLGGEQGQLVVDAKRMVPVKSVLGQLEETFADYAAIDASHWAPLSVTVAKPDGLQFEWKFRLHEPGLWLLDYSEYRGARVAWVDRVEVNAQSARLLSATKASLEQAKAEQDSTARAQQFLAANRHWLLPALAGRRGLVYDYRQEPPYRERIIFDPAGHVMARLEANKEHPDTPSRQRLWFPDGSWVDADAQAPLVRTHPSAAPGGAKGEDLLLQDRHVQHLAMGLALECGLTGLARDPGAFRAETRPLADDPQHYLLVLHPKKDARLFTGTMLIFSSWAYMHDVRYGRSEVLCEAATHRPVEEKDFDGQELKGHYRFDNYVDGPSGAAPSRICALVPHSKDGQDRSLEMEARFGFARPGLWLLERVQSSFRGGEGGSTGVVSVVEAKPQDFAPVQTLLERQRYTRDLLQSVASAPQGRAEAQLRLGDWQPLALRPAWSDKARKSLSYDEDNRAPDPGRTIAVHRARLTRQTGGALRLDLEGVTTTWWKEFLTEWKATLAGGDDRRPVKSAASIQVRCEGAPGLFTVTFPLAAAELDQAATLKLTLEGAVPRMTGAYHGHGVWYRFADKE